ncbi:MAG: isoprenylcysteine carboxylmethyltransferase family protein [Anaerolineae bacterium]|nr:isoprenylcysteine carboxylmethyltransferase family protein [Anaerolineae bacterium]NIN97403.1 isoprenylcysteine carboxylmethyltransferase family protein [Anaerolineae bacterium]NIQ80332.1 isoprenylcysteine carboxylmethyltransferase family protein [Anaerolineae bacterium]
MHDETGFRIIFLALCMGLFAIRFYYYAKVRLAGESVLVSRQAIQTQSSGMLALRATLFLGFVVAVIIYAVKPEWMRWFILPLPPWLRWGGAVSGLVSLVLLVWVQHTLGRYWSSDLQLREEHALVTGGPYRWVRHPMYAVTFMFLIALTLVSANALFAVGTVLALLLLWRRIDDEERMMVARFGDDYRNYTKQSRAFAAARHQGYRLARRS